MLTIATWLWRGTTKGGTSYTADHVNRWAAMLDRHSNQRLDLVCITDNAEGIDGGIRTVPLWDDLAEHGRCFRRLKAFSRDAADIIAPHFVSMDLDCVVVGNIDPLFTERPPFRIWSKSAHRPRAFRLFDRAPFCGALWQLQAGAKPEVFDDFDRDELSAVKARKKLVGSDQAWIAHKLPDSPVWTYRDGVVSLRQIKRRKHLPKHAKIVFFNGSNDPSMGKVQERYPWVRANWCL